MKSFLMLALFLSANLVHALEIDEKLTLRFLKVSNSKKTILINRGAEDGLTVGDHAKFFITAGVIARGVVEKVSPSRSIWSLYRVVDTAEITEGKVLNLKIATPVKITADPSKSMKEEEIPAGSDKMSIDESADTTTKSTDEDKKEMEELGIEEEMKPAPKKEMAKKAPKEVSMDETPDVRVEQASSKSSREWEIWAMAYINALSGTTDESTDTTDTSTATTASTFDFSGGLEKYFFNSTGFLKEVSLSAFLHKRTIESGSQIKVTSDWFEFGGAGNYHFYNSAASLNHLIGYASVTGGIGTATVKQTVVTNGVSTESPDVKGSNMFFSLGLGAKYNTNSGFGVRALIDYYVSNEKYEYDGGATAKRSLSGPRWQVGLSYRF